MGEPLPSVTIAIATYNRAAMLLRAVGSVIMQTYPHVEVCIFDDGSTDDTAAKVSQLQNRAQLRGSARQIHYVRGRCNSGIAVAKNAALQMGSGELRGVLDDDDWYEPTFVERCVAELQAHPESVCVYTDNWLAYEGQERVLAPAAEWNNGEALLRGQLRGDCYLARWSALERTALHDESMALDLDYDLFAQLAKLGEFRRIPEPLLTVTHHLGRSTQNRERAAYWNGALLGKHGFPFEATAMRAQNAFWMDAVRAGYAWGVRRGQELGLLAA